MCLIFCKLDVIVYLKKSLHQEIKELDMMCEEILDMLHEEKYADNHLYILSIFSHNFGFIIFSGSSKFVCEEYV